MVIIKGFRFSRGDVPRLAKENEIRLGGSITDKKLEILAEVLQISTTLETLWFNDASSAVMDKSTALRNSKFIEALAKNRTIKTLNLTYGACCGDEDAKALAVVLEENSTIDSISLFSGYIGAEGAAALADALKKNDTLQTINLGYNEIGVEGASALADALKVNSSLQELYLKGNQIGDEGAKALAGALRVNSCLQELDLGENNISEVGAASIADALKENKTLDTIRLVHNKIGDGGAASLAEAFKDNNNLTTIDLECNIISDDGASALADALKVNSSLQELNLEANNISDEGAAAMAEALKVNSSLQAFDLSCNNISDVGAAATAEALKENVTLKTLRLASNNIGDTGGKAILNTLQQSGNSSIEYIALYLNQMTLETLYEINEEIKRIQKSIRTVGVDGGQQLLSTITRLQRELVEKDEVIAQKDGEIASIKATLKKIGVIANGKDNDSNNEGGEAPQSKHRETESGDRNHLSQREKEMQSEIDFLREQLKNSRPIETVDLTTVEPSSATDDDSNEEEPPSKRRRTKSNLASALEQSQQMVAVKEEAIQRATTAEASAEAARREKDAVESSLRDVQEDLEIQQETTQQVAVTLDTWQSRFDRVHELAEAAGVDAAVLRSI